MGYVIECPLHYACFDVRTGKLLSGPVAVDVPAYQVRVEEFGRRRAALVGRRDILRERADAQRDEEVRHAVETVPNGERLFPAP